MIKQETIKGKVAGIIDDFTLVLNIGSENGVRQGMNFVIYELGGPVIDPGTDTELGNLEIVKGFVEVINVQPKLCTVESKETKIDSFGIAALQKIRRVPLPISKVTIGKSPNQTQIIVGDFARQIF